MKQGIVRASFQAGAALDALGSVDHRNAALVETQSLNGAGLETGGIVALPAKRDVEDIVLHVLSHAQACQGGIALALMVEGACQDARLAISAEIGMGG
jgi:hypothetical protein